MKLRNSQINHTPNTFSVSMNGTNSFVDELKKKQQIQDRKENFWKTATRKLSLHGVHFLGDESLGTVDKIVWAILMIIAIIATVHVSILISHRFNNSPLSTVFEDTNYLVSNIPFPAVTVCNNNRLNLSKMNEAVKKFYPGRSTNQTNLFIKMVENFQNFDSGSFNELKTINQLYHPEFDQVNLTEVILFLSIDCKEFLMDCWWVGVNYNCCSLFKRQLGTYGACFSFNSNTHIGENNVSFKAPTKTLSSGDWGGLKVWINTRPKYSVRRYNSVPGVYVLLHDSHEWPTQARFIPAGLEMAVVLEPILFSTSSEVRNIHYNERLCIFEDEANTNNMLLLNKLPYSEKNCFAECEKQIAYAHCNCVIGWMFPRERSLQDCNISGLSCMEKYHKSFIAYKVKNENLPKNLSCLCLPECHRIDYDFYLEPCFDSFEYKEDPDVNKDDIVLLDVHFKSRTMVKYRTDVVFGILDLIAAFGGIAGLFLGCSILTFVEFTYLVISSIILKFRKISTK